MFHVNGTRASAVPAMNSTLWGGVACPIREFAHTKQALRNSKFMCFSASKNRGGRTNQANVCIGAYAPARVLEEEGLRGMLSATS